MKKYFFMAVAAIAALSSCSNNDEFEQTQIGNQGLVFTATMEGSEGTRATYDATNKCALWEAGDKISINGVSYSAQTAGATTTFKATTKGQEAKPIDDTYHAFFPASLYNGTKATLPATQTYTVSKFNMPMYAESTTTELKFKNICAVLAIKVTSADITTLKSIKVKSNKKLNGTFTVNSTTDGVYKAVIGTDGTEEVVLTSNDAVTLDETGTTFYIAIPAQEYSYLKIYLSEDGTLYKRAMITKKATGLGTIACNTIYNINYETNAIQMYADGPYWSTMNLGATNPQDYGRYFQWGEIAGHECNGTKNGSTFKDGHNFNWASAPFNDKSSSYNSSYFTTHKGTWLNSDDVLTSDNDAAYKTWGSSWRMPTMDDFTALANACTGGYTSGNISLTTKTTFAGVTAQGVYWITNYNSGDKIKGLVFCDGTNKLFFPAAGYGNGASLSDPGDGSSYWSSTLYSSSPHGAYRLFITSFSVNPQGITNRYFGFPVRPVSD